MGKPETLAKSKRNNAVDFWRVFCTLGVALMHFNGSGMLPSSWMGNIYAGTPDSQPLMWIGGVLLEFFLITGGFFMVASYKSKQRKGLTANKRAASQAWTYGLGRFKMFWPCLLLGNLFGIVLKCLVNHLSPLEWFYAFCVNIWDFTGLAELTAMGPTASRGATYMIDAVDFVHPWAVNYPLWYISALLIVCVPMYFLLAVDEDRFKTIWMPLFSILYIGGYGLTSDFLMNRGQLLTIGIPVNILWVGGGMACGAMLWYLVDFLKAREIGSKGKTFLTILNLACTAFLIITSITNAFAWTDPQNGPIWFNEMIYMPAFACVLVCNSLNQDAVTKLLNWPFLGKLGGFSLYWFCAHYPIAHLLNFYLVANGGPLSFLDHNYIAVLVIFLIATTAVGLILQFLCKKGLEPCIDSVIKAVKPTVPAQQ